MAKESSVDLFRDSIPHDQLIKDLRGFQLLSELLKEIAGINLPQTDKNLSLVASRLHSLLKRRGINGYKSLHKAIRLGDDALKREFVECLTTNKTEFFREKNHFDVLANYLPSLLEENRLAGRRELRIWCAAASTGQEPYSLAMTLMESIEDLSLWDVKFLATDIDRNVLEYCSRGVYTEHEARDLDASFSSRYFQKVKAGTELCYKVIPEMRHMIRFAPFNLMENPFPFQHKFDVIFCRNVLIYFDRETQAAVVSRLVQALRVGGILFIGHTETGVPKPEGLETVAVAAYRKLG